MANAWEEINNSRSRLYSHIEAKGLSPYQMILVSGAYEEPLTKYQDRNCGLVVTNSIDPRTVARELPAVYEKMKQAALGQLGIPKSELLI